MSVVDKTHLPPSPWALLFPASPHPCLLYHQTLNTDFPTTKCLFFPNSDFDGAPSISAGQPQSGLELEVWRFGEGSGVGGWLVGQRFDIQSSSLFRASERQAGLINSEINKEGCSYVSLQMWGRCIDRRWAFDTSILVSSHFPSPNEASVLLLISTV